MLTDSPAVLQFRSVIIAFWNRSGATQDETARRFGITPKQVQAHIRAARRDGTYVRPSRFRASNLRRHANQSAAPGGRPD